MKKTCSILVVLCLLIPLVSSAQTVSNRQKRLMREKVLDVIDAYDMNSSISSNDKDGIYEFEHLFTEDAKIICDMMGTPSYLKNVSPKQYIQTVNDYSGEYGIYSGMYDIKIGNIDYEKGEVVLTFNKHLSYSDKDDISFDLSDYYGGSGVLEASMKLVYNNAEKRFYIVSITGRLNTEKNFPAVPFYVIDNDHILANEDTKNKSKLISMIHKSDGSELDLSRKIVFYPSDTEFDVEDFDVELTPIKKLSTTKAYEKVSFQMTQMASRMKVRMAYAPFFAYDVKASDLVKSKSWAFEFDLDYGKTFSLGAKSKMGVYVGLGLSCSSLNLSLGDDCKYLYSIKNEDDSSTDLENSYEHNYIIRGARESVMYTDLYVPIYFEMEHRLGRSKQLILTWNLGVKPYVNIMSSKTRKYAVDFTYKYKYKDKDDLTIIYSQKINYDKFDSFEEENTYKKPFDLSVFGNVGVDFGLSRKFYLTLQVGYERGFIPYESTTSPYIDDVNGHYPIIPEISDGKVEHKAVHSLISGIKMNRSSLWLSLGVKLKF